MIGMSKERQEIVRMSNCKNTILGRLKMQIALLGFWNGVGAWWRIEKLIRKGTTGKVVDK